MYDPRRVETPDAFVAALSAKRIPYDAHRCRNAHVVMADTHDRALSSASPRGKAPAEMKLGVERKMIIDRRSLAKAAAMVVTAGFLISTASAEDMKHVALPGNNVYPESIAAASDGTLYISGLASGGIYRVKPGASVAEEWIKPGAYDTRSTFGVLVDEAKGLLLVCSNDASGIGVPGPGAVPGTFIKGFDLKTGEGKLSVAFPKAGSICNDFAIGEDGSIFATNTSSPQILRLKPGSNELEVWLESADFNQPKEGAGLDGIAFGGDGNLYVNTYTNAELYRVDVKDGKPGNITKLKTSRPLMVCVRRAVSPSSWPKEAAASIA